MCFDPSRGSPSIGNEPSIMVDLNEQRGACQIKDCLELLPETQYHKRYRICNYHAALPKMQLSGALVRFCQQCGRFQALEDFDGSRKTCRKKLQLHNELRRRKRERRSVAPARLKQRSPHVTLSAPLPQPSIISNTSQELPSNTSIPANHRLQMPSSNTARAPCLHYPLEDDLLEGLDIDALLDHLAPYDVNMVPQIPTATVSNQVASQGLATPPGPGTANINPAAVLASTLPLEGSLPDHWFFRLPQYRSSVSPGQALLSVDAGKMPSVTASLPPAFEGTIKPPKQHPAPTHPALHGINSTSQCTNVPFRYVGSALLAPLPAALQPMQLQRSVSAQELRLHNASYALFNAPPSELPRDVCNALKESLASQLRSLDIPLK